MSMNDASMRKEGATEASARGTQGYETLESRAAATNCQSTETNRSPKQHQSPITANQIKSNVLNRACPQARTEGATVRVAAALVHLRSVHVAVRVPVVVEADRAVDVRLGGAAPDAA